MQATDAVTGIVILCDVFVPGHAKTKGSMQPLGNGKMVDKPSSRVWRKLIAERVKGDAAKRHAHGYVAEASMQYDGRVGVRIISYGHAGPAKTPTGNWLSTRLEAWLIARAGFGDVDKLARNVLDAISSEDKDDAHLIADDSQVVDLFSHKRLALPGTMVGQQITVWAIPENAPW